MAINVVRKSVPSTDGVHTLQGVLYVPEGAIRGLVQIVHGMAEHIGRYDDFLTYLAKNGILAFGYDHLGHGKTAKDESEHGFFAHRGGYTYVVDDVRAFADAVKADYPGKKLVLLGHSMGSFVVRLFAAKYPQAIDGLIIMGTGGKNPVAGMGIASAKLVRFFCGEKHISGLINSLAFGKYNERTEKKTPFDWVTSDIDRLKNYQDDPACGFDFTVSGMIDLVTMNKASNEKAWYASMRKDLPVLVVSGTEDPVGAYGKGPTEVADGLRTAGLDDVELKLYAGARHEILNDFSRGEVYQDILSWVTKK